MHPNSWCVEDARELLGLRNPRISHPAKPDLNIEHSGINILVSVISANLLSVRRLAQSCKLSGECTCCCIQITSV